MSLAATYMMRKKMKSGQSQAPHVEEMAEHVMSHPDSDAIVSAIMEKRKMACGGMVEEYADGGEVEEEAYSESGDDLFSHDAPESEGEEDPKKKRKKMLAEILSKTRFGG